MLGALLIPPPLSAAQTTQTLSLDEGWNLVSLRVQPDDPSFASIFGTDGAISSVKNEDGAAYLPDLGIEQISTWRADEGYKVHAEAATTVKIVGTELPPGSVAIALEEGGNIVPYLPDGALAVEEAVMSIEESLIAVEDEDGRRYPSGSPPLDSLRPGQGYKVYVDRADTLRYPVVVKTLDDALALTGMEVGSHVRVQGYHELGDGGGGLFRVTNSDAGIDGGTVFAFDEDLSAEQSEAVSGSPTWTLSNTDIDFNSFEIKYGPDNNDKLGALGMHGHMKTETNQDWLDLKSGEVLGGANPLAALNSNFGNGNKEYIIRYRYATSVRRLERVRVTDAVNIAWWGAPTADPNNVQLAGRHLATAINRAAELYQENGLDWAYVDIPGTYYYRHLYRIRNGVKLRGTGPDRNVPGVSWTTNGELRIPPGDAMYTHHVDFDGGAEHDEEAVMRGSLNGGTQYLTNEYMASKIGIQDLTINGNLEHNEYVFNNQGEYDDLINRLQNASDWTGFYTTGAGSLEYEDRMRFEIDRLNSVGFGGNNIGSAGVDVTDTRNGSGIEVYSEDVRLENAVRNHQLYSVPGPKKKNWRIVGQSWATPAKVGSKAHRESNYTNLTIIPARNKWFGDGGVLNAIGKNITIDGFEIDLSGEKSGRRIRFTNDNNGNNVYKNGTLKSPKNNQLSWVAVNRFHLPIEYKNIDVVDGGGGIVFGAPFNNDGDNYFWTNVTVETADGVGDIPPLQDQSLMFGFQLRPPRTSVAEATKENWERAMRNGFRQFTYNRKNRTRVFRINDDAHDAPYHPFDIFFVDSEIDNASGANGDNSKFITFKGGNDPERARTAFRLYWDSMTFNTLVERSNSFHKWARPGGLLRMRNSQDRSGRTSDASGTYTSDASDEGNDSVLIPTSLLSRAWARSATVTSGSPAVQSIEVANSDGSLRADDNTRQEDPYLKVNLDQSISAGETIDVDWTARVTPLDDFQTTGLFVSRPVADKSLTSGNGPWTEDLRGVAASQESRDKIIYTASSGDTSVATASVQGDDVTLKIVGQGTGTATITVDAEIPGVGTTTDTFEVTIE